ncbi:MAG: hypothetical protein MI919_04670 [Holophagales bacterium]|nr:hypothetical protein [Holophagales bacterium]
MYLRKSVRKKDGKAHTYWCVVRSVRRNGKVVQETVAQLGELDAQGQAQARVLARQMTGGADQLELFEPRLEPSTIPIHLDRIRLERSRSFARVHLGWCERLLPSENPLRPGLARGSGSGSDPAVERMLLALPEQQCADAWSRNSVTSLLPPGSMSSRCSAWQGMRMHRRQLGMTGAASRRSVERSRNSGFRMWPRGEIYRLSELSMT